MTAAVNRTSGQRTNNSLVDVDPRVVDVDERLPSALAVDEDARRGATGKGHVAEIECTVTS